MHFIHTAPVLNTDIKRGNYFFRKKLLFSEQTNGTFSGSRYIMIFTLLLKPQFFKILVIVVYKTVLCNLQRSLNFSFNIS
jgi:hypothetical protein